MKQVSETRLRELIEKGASVDDIARESETSHEIIYARLKELNLLRRIISGKSKRKRHDPG